MALTDSEHLVESAAAGDDSDFSLPALPLDLLQAIGQALLIGTAWESVFRDPRWANYMLYIVYTHDELGTPDEVAGVAFERRDAEALAERAAQRLHSTNPLNRIFYKSKIAEWPLGGLALREARDGFHHDVIKHVVMQIKMGLRLLDALPDGVSEVRIGPARQDSALPGYVDVTGRRIVLWEDCCSFSASGDTIGFTMTAAPGLSGLMNADGDIIVPAAFQHVASLCEGLAVAKRNGKFGYIDARGTIIVPFVFEDALDCGQGLLLVKTNGLWGAIDIEGNEIIAPRFDALEHDIGNEALRATLEGRHGYLSLSGELLVGYAEQQFNLVERSFVAERSIFIIREERDGQPSYMLADAQGRQIGMQSFAGIHYGFPEEGLLVAQRQEAAGLRYGYVDFHGDTVIPFDFSDARNFSEGLAAVTKSAAAAGYGYIDRLGEWVIPPKFDFAGEFHQGLAPASGPPMRKWPYTLIDQLLDRLNQAPAATTKRYGYIDRSGNWVIDQNFLEAKPFNEGMAAVRMETGWGYIDINGTHVTPALYHEAGPFKQGIARVARRFDGPLRYGLVDICGREIIPLRFDWLSYPKRGLITACDEYGLWGCFTIFGNIVLPFIYREAHDLQIALAARNTVPQ